MYNIIMKKRDGEQLSREEIEYFVNGYVDGTFPDYQASALLMAIYFQGMSERETVDLTMALKNSGDSIDLSRFGSLSADKHSTGGVGDKTTLVVAPVVACLGGKVAKMSGKGLGHTGGTVDKLDSIPGFKTELSGKEFLDQVEKIGVAVIGQTGNMTPGDKKLYALRDVTATVDSIPLIVSSIMSKKLAAGSKNITLDVKFGSGAFMKTEQDAAVLAEEMVKIGKLCGRNITAVISNMDYPLGKNIGNALEVKEAVEVLKGKGDKELTEVCVILASELLTLFNGKTLEQNKSDVLSVLENGRAFSKFKSWISAQGGDVNVIDKIDEFCKPKYEHKVKFNVSGYINYANAEEIGKASVLLGAGRKTKEDKIDYSAGIVLHFGYGQKIEKGEVGATLYSSTVSDFAECEKAVLNAITVSNTPPKKRKLISKVIK